MYKHFEPSEKIFVDREEYLDWMDEALKRCEEKSVVLHLRGIGGIGKSSLLEHWKKTVETSIVLDCQQYTEFYDRLNVIAKEVVLLGIPLRRFDVLWQIRQRFVQGVEPVKESGREWAKEVIAAIPFIGSLVSIGSAISAVGAKVVPILKGKYGIVGKWLQDTLGKNHVERLLEILWKDPHHAEFLYLDALLEDVNDRKVTDPPILFLFDHFEYVDAESSHWRYARKEITEAELWRVFLSSLSKCVGVMASRRHVTSKTTLTIEESELTELDRESCIKLLELRKIIDPDLQERIVSVSGGNPFVVGTFCDMADSGTLSLEAVENLRAETLEEVRLKTWRRLFSQVKDLQGLVNRTGLVPFFSRKVMNIIAPEMDTDQWTRLTHFSFVKDRGDGTFTLNDLARDLIVTELDHRITDLAKDASSRLESAFEKESDYALLGLSVSVLSLASETEALVKLHRNSLDLMWKGALIDAISFHDYNRIQSIGGQACRLLSRGWILNAMKRVVEAETHFKDVIEIVGKISDDSLDDLRYWLADAYNGLGSLYIGLDRLDEAEDAMREGIRIAISIDERTPGYALSSVALMYSTLGDLLVLTKRYGEAETEYQEALRIQESIMKTPYGHNPSEERNNIQIYKVLLAGFANVLLQLGKASEAEDLARRAIEIEGDHLPDLWSFAIFGTLFRLMNRISEAKVALEKFLEIGRTMAEMDEQLMSYPVDPLVNMGILHMQIGKLTEAEKLFREALEISSELSEKEPERGKGFSALSLRNLATVFQKDGKFSEAESAYTESLEFYRQAAEMFPNRYQDIVADVLNSYAITLRLAGKAQESENTYVEALDISQKLVHNFPEAVLLDDLQAVILNNYGVLLRNMNNNQEALESYQKALVILKQLADKSPDLFIHHYATILSNLGVLLSELGDNSEAERKFNECLEIRKELKKKSEEFFLPSIASCLNNLGIVLMRDNQTQASEEAFRESIIIQEELSTNEPRVYQQPLSRAINNLIILLSRIGKTDEIDVLTSRLGEFGITEINQEAYWSEEEIRALVTYFWIY